MARRITLNTIMQEILQEADPQAMTGIDLLGRPFIVHGNRTSGEGILTVDHHDDRVRFEATYLRATVPDTHRIDVIAQALYRTRLITKCEHQLRGLTFNTTRNDPQSIRTIVKKYVMAYNQSAHAYNISQIA